MHVEILGATGGKIERDMNASADATARVTPVQFSMSGKEKLVVVVTGAQ